MRQLTTHTDPDSFAGGYGTDWRQGVLSDHVDLFQRAGGVVRTSPSGRTEWALMSDGTAVPIVCSEIIRIDTEDGPMSGRCGATATTHGACDGHAEIRAAWLAMDEADRVAMERREAEADLYV